MIRNAKMKKLNEKKLKSEKFIKREKFMKMKNFEILIFWKFWNLFNNPIFDQN